MGTLPKVIQLEGTVATRVLLVSTCCTDIACFLAMHGSPLWFMGPVLVLLVCRNRCSCIIALSLSSEKPEMGSVNVSIDWLAFSMIEFSGAGILHTLTFKVGLCF